MKRCFEAEDNRPSGTDPRGAARYLRLSFDSMADEEKHDEEEKERLLRKKVNKASGKPTAAAQGPLLRPFRTIVILAIIILILLLLIFFFGLGSGGGKVLPGSGDSSESSFSIPMPEPKDDGPKQVVRCELTVSFFPAATEPERAEEGLCRLDWTDAQDETPKTLKIEALHMADFYASLEKALRSWRISLESKQVVNEPVLIIRMTPFPGVGVFQKIKKIAQDIDGKIVIVEQGVN